MRGGIPQQSASSSQPPTRPFSTTGRSAWDLDEWKAQREKAEAKRRQEDEIKAKHRAEMDAYYAQQAEQASEREKNGDGA
jgi:hypothetical protein